ncbi:hypothetical protein AA0229_0574 [Gluconobacter cerinus NRIC 0229]|uniref:Uncharacterized protein n=1 Tax=Gluconobacter cerinus TaxID=38307 RepID=A0AAV5NC07_9PROT|nr:hypothetical protein AA0229_0574 [Gluconobacter cerinus NRIC 0229]GLQ61821.1 hypothetical protein GCM10007867_06660 [Gluconobacter cerinus]
MRKFFRNFLIDLTYIVQVHSIVSDMCQCLMRYIRGGAGQRDDNVPLVQQFLGNDRPDASRRARKNDGFRGGDRPAV